VGKEAKAYALSFSFMFYQERASWQNCCDAVEKLHITAVR